MSPTIRPFANEAVATVFAEVPEAPRARLLALRQLILDTAAENEEIGALTEDLRWGEPAYLPQQSKSGTTVRIAWKPSEPDQVSLFVHCGTTLISDFRELQSEAMRFVGNRQIALPLSTDLPEPQLRLFIEAALTYHARKRGA